MLKALGNGGKVLNTVGKVAKPIGIATDATRITTAYIEDGGKIGNATITTSSSVAGGWAGAWGGAVLVGKGGVAIGGYYRWTCRRCYWRIRRFCSRRHRWSVWRFMAW